jgi:hypothetical protein
VQQQMSDFVEGDGAPSRPGNIEGALTAKGDGQILQQRMAAERARKQDEMARAELRKAEAAAEKQARTSDPVYTRALGRAGSRADAFSQPETHTVPKVRKPAEAKEWVYIDAQKVQQGPFTLTQMQQWYAAGYLPDSTEVKHNDDVDFTTVGQQSRIYVAASVGTSHPTKPVQPRQQYRPQQQQVAGAFQSCTHSAFTPGCPCCMAYAQPQQHAAHGGYYQHPAIPAAHAASVAREVASAAGGGGPGSGANALGVAGGVDKKKKKKKKEKLGNAVSTRAMPAFKAARTTKDLWSAPSEAGINLF